MQQVKRALRDVERAQQQLRALADALAQPEPADSAPTTIDRLRQSITEHPDWTSAMHAEAIGVTPLWAWQLCKQHKLTVPHGRRPARTLATVAGALDRLRSDPAIASIAELVTATGLTVHQLRPMLTPEDRALMAHRAYQRKYGALREALLANPTEPLKSLAQRFGTPYIYQRIRVLEALDGRDYLSQRVQRAKKSRPQPLKMVKPRARPLPTLSDP